jgi:hypothetical protein
MRWRRARVGALVGVGVAVTAACGGRVEPASLASERFAQDAGHGSGPEATADGAGGATGDGGSPGSGACGPRPDRSAQAVGPDGICGEGINVGAPPDLNCSGDEMAETAFEYVPSTDLLVARIELFTTGGVIGLRDSKGPCGMPGDVLFQDDLDRAIPDPANAKRQWRGADVSPPIQVHAGHTYYVITGAGSLTQLGITCSVSSGGTPVREWGRNLHIDPDHWDGPFEALWMAHVIGACP